MMPKRYRDGGKGLNKVAWPLFLVTVVIWWSVQHEGRKA
jgi:hypothetical protein